MSNTPSNLKSKQMKKKEEDVPLTAEQKVDTFRASISALKDMQQTLLHQMMTFIVEEQPEAENLDKVAAAYAQDSERFSRIAAHLSDDLLVICKEAAALGSRLEAESPKLTVMETEENADD